VLGISHECRLIEPSRPQSIYCRLYNPIKIELKCSALCIDTFQVVIKIHLSRAIGGGEGLIGFLLIISATQTLSLESSLCVSRRRGNVQVRRVMAAADPLSAVHYSCIKIHYARGGIIKRTHSNMH
jgi:hypothetical protein